MKPAEDTKVDQKGSRKPYEKPSIIHTSSIETMAGSCEQTIGCTPEYGG